MRKKINVAAAYTISKEMALEQMLAIKSLEHYYLYHTSVGECLHLPDLNYLISCVLVR